MTTTNNAMETFHEQILKFLIIAMSEIEEAFEKAEEDINKINTKHE